MIFPLFPKQDYWLSSPMSPDAVAESILNDIADYRNKRLMDLIDEFADETTRTFRYFEGSVNKLGFKIYRHHGRKQYRPVLYGEIEANGDSSLVHVAAGVSMGEQLSYVCGTAGIIAITVKKGTGLLFAILGCIGLAWARYDYLKKSKGDKAELIDILRATEVNRPAVVS